MDFAVPDDYEVKVEESKKKKKKWTNNLTLPKNWKSYGTWKWQKYHWLWKRDAMNWRLEEESKQSRSQHS